MSPYELSEHVNEVAKVMEETISKSSEKLESTVKKFIEDSQVILWDSIRYELCDNSSESFKYAVAYEVDKIVEALILGDQSAIEKFKLESKYTWEKLDKMRRAIWAAANPGIVNGMVVRLEEEIKDLKNRIYHLQYPSNY